MMKKAFYVALFSCCSAAFALQGGPSQPDYIQFEPSKLQDMVSLTSGNFTYSIPLGEVPGSYGNYPLSISYHAGISPQQEASWVGLGWTLSPGGIIRDVRGVPDDQFHGGTLGYIYQYSATYTWSIDLSYSNGPYSVGVTASSTGGVGTYGTVGFHVAGAVDAGFTVSTNQGFGVDASVGYGQVGLNASVMFNPRDRKVTYGAGVKVGTGVSASVGVHYTTGEDVSYSVGMSARPKGDNNSFNIMKASVRKGGTSTSLGPVSVSVANSSRSGSSKSSSAGFAIVVPTYVGVFSLGFSQSLHEYHMRSATSDYVYGYLYQGGPGIVADGDNNIDEIPDAQIGAKGSSGRIPWKWTFKGRSLETLGDEKLQPAYDMFTVETEGVAGTFRAFTREEHQMYNLLSNSLTDGNESVESYNPILKLDENRWPYEEEFVYEDNNQKKDSEYHFYSSNAPYAKFKTQFMNEANRFVYRADMNDENPLSSGISFLFLGEGGYYETEPYESTKKEKNGEVTKSLLKRTVGGNQYALYGSRKVEPIFEDDSPVSTIKGFRITNSDGTKYIFGKPVKTYLKVDYTINQEKGTPAFVDRGLSKYKGFWDSFVDAVLTFVYPSRLFNGIRKAMQGELEEKCQSDASDETEIYSYQVNMNPYATQWLLTEIQGADFVELDKNDISKNIGYNVKFNYGNPSLYQWRTPYAQPNVNSSNLPNSRIPRNGMTPVGCDTKMYQAAFGVKEYVYLKSIETATHKVVFDLNDSIKEQRVDGKGWFFNRESEESKKTLPIFTTAALSVTVESMEKKPLFFPQMKERNEQQKTYLMKDFGKVYEGEYVYDALYVNIDLPELLKENIKSKNKFVIETDYSKKVISIGSQEGGKGSRDEFIFLNDEHEISVDEDLVNAIEKTSGEDARYGLYKIKLKKGDRKKFFMIPKSSSSVYNKAINGGVKIVLAENGRVYEDGVIETKKGGETLIHECDLKLYDVPIEGSSSSSDYSNYGYPNANSTNGYNAPTERMFLPCDEKVEFNSLVKNYSLVKAPEKIVDGSLIAPVVDWSDIVFSSDFTDFSTNQVRFLKKISYYDKKNSEPYREYAFEYDYSLHPKTLNSYCKDLYPTTLEDIQSSPINASLDVCSNGQTNKYLYGRLTLKSITEKGCQNGHCASLPPFKFDYSAPSQTSTRYSTKSAWAELSAQNVPKVTKEVIPEELKGTTEDEGDQSNNGYKREHFYSEDYYSGVTDVDASIVASYNSIDEWGFWNNRGEEDNHKVNQSFADYGAAAWSLNKITDPAGGVMEISYERDSYKDGEDHSSEYLYAPIYKIEKCSEFIKKYPNAYIGYNDQYNNRTCAQFLPMFWKDQCLGPRMAYWDYKKPKGYKGGNYDYMYELGIVQKNENGKDEINKKQEGVYFNAHSVLKTEVDCGPLGLSDCDRYRNVGLLGFTKFDAMYEGNLDISTADLPSPYKIIENNVYKLGKVKVNARLLVMDKSYNEVYAGFQVAADKINDDLSWNQRNVDGVMWKKRSYSDMKGGDIRVKKLVRYDIDRIAKTEYEYKPGEIAQLPDSTYTTVMGSRHNVDMMSYAMPDLPLKPKSRIVGFDDNDLLYVPGSTVMYPKVSVKNSDNDDKVSNGKIEFEYITSETGIPADYIDSETKKSLKPFIHVNANLFAWGGDKKSEAYKTRPFVVKFDFLDEYKNKVGKPMNVMLLQGRPVSFNFYNDNVQSVRYLNASFCKNDYDCERISLKNDGIKVYDMDLGSLNDFNEVTVTIAHILSNWSFNKNWVRSQEKGFYPILYKEIVYGEEMVSLDKANEANDEIPAQNLMSQFEEKVIYHDFTSFIGMNNKISYYRGNGDKAILIKVDSSIYSTSVPDALNGVADGDQNGIAGKIGKQHERWNSTRELQCVEANKEKCKREQIALSSRKKNTQEKIDYFLDKTSFEYKRYPAFMVKSVTINGFDDQDDLNSSSSSPDLNKQRALLNTKKWHKSVVENHRYDPVTSMPTATVAKIPSVNGGELHKLTVKLPHHAVCISCYSNSSASTESSVRSALVTSLAERMFKRNMLSQNFAEFVYYDSIPHYGNDSWNYLERNKYLKSFNMNLMKLYDGIFYKSSGSSVDAEDKPLVDWGVFSSKVLPEDILKGSSLFSKKYSADGMPYGFVVDYHDETASNLPKLDEFNGKYILKMDEYFKTIESKDVLGRIQSTHYSVDGRFLTNIFFPTDYSKTASIVPVGNDIRMVNANLVGVKDGEHVVENGSWIIKEAMSLSCANFVCGDNLIAEYRIKKKNRKWTTERVDVNSLRLSLDVDDRLNYLRIYPEDAKAETFVYDAYGNMIQMVGEDNLSIYYDYNPLGQLISTRNDDGVSFKALHREFRNDDRKEIPWNIFGLFSN